MLVDFEGEWQRCQDLEKDVLKELDKCESDLEQLKKENKLDTTSQHQDETHMVAADGPKNSTLLAWI